MNEKEHASLTGSIGELIARTYGPYAFGAVILLAIWFVIVRPELESRAIDFQSQQRIIEKLNEMSLSQQQVANNLTQTALTTNLTATTLERIVERLEIYSELNRDQNGKPKKEQ